MTPDSGILTNIEQSILGVFQSGFGNILPDAFHLLGLLAILDLAISALFWALKSEDFTATFIRKILIISLFIYFVQNWQTLTNTVVQGFIYAGTKAGGGAGVPSLGNPSSIIDYAWSVTDPINKEIAVLQKASWAGLNATIIDLMLCKVLILFAIFIIAIQAFICYLEFYIIAVLSMILIPFGVFKHTAFLAEKAIGSIISFGVKLMVLAFVLSASMPVIESYALPADPTFQQAMCLSVAAIAIAILAWSAPKIASGMMSGSPSLSVKDAATAAAGTWIGAAAGYEAGKSGINAISSGVQSTVKAANAASEGYREGGLTGAVKAVGSSFSGNNSSSSIERMSEAKKAGQLRPYNGGNTSLGSQQS